MNNIIYALYADDHLGNLAFSKHFPDPFEAILWLGNNPNYRKHWPIRLLLITGDGEHTLLATFHSATVPIAVASAWDYR